MDKPPPKRAIARRAGISPAALTPADEAALAAGSGSGQESGPLGPCLARQRGQLGKFSLNGAAPTALCRSRRRRRSSAPASPAFAAATRRPPIRWRLSAIGKMDLVQIRVTLEAGLTLPRQMDDGHADFQFVVCEWIDVLVWRRGCRRETVGSWPFRRWRDQSGLAI
jgi:hypothetical protein